MYKSRAPGHRDDYLLFLWWSPIFARFQYRINFIEMFWNLEILSLRLRISENFSHFNYAASASYLTASTSHFIVILPSHTSLHPAATASANKPTTKPKTTVKYLQIFNKYPVNLANAQCVGAGGHNEVFPVQLFPDLHAWVPLFTIN